MKLLSRAIACTQYLFAQGWYIIVYYRWGLYPICQVTLLYSKYIDFDNSLLSGFISDRLIEDKIINGD